MRFNEAVTETTLNEYNPAVPLHTWNAEQKTLWRKITGHEEVAPEEVPRWMILAKKFDELYTKKKRFPNASELKREMKL
jgi:hypothetical protein